MTIHSGRAVQAAPATLLAIAVVFRIVGLAWLGTLSALSLATTPGGTRPGVIIVTVVSATLWTLATVLVWRRSPQVLSGWRWLVPDMAIGAAVALVPGEVDAGSFFVGGFPISSAILLATTRGVGGGAVGGLIIAVASARGYAGEVFARTAEVVAINALAPVVIGWGFNSIRRNDALRTAAEEELASERAERVRVAERAEVAAHLHDSVLQTLALIQRRADDRVEVLKLARSQERELRSWLNGAGPGDAGLMDSIKRSAGEIEAQFGVVVDVSTVGDAPLDRDVEAIAAATREAIMNSAKFARADRIYVLAEARPNELRVVIRDRGIGFDRSQVGGDRRGLGESIEGRMQRHGGMATIWSRAGDGTEVDLRLPRKET